MADATYSTKVYRQQEAERLVVASGGSLDVESGGEIDVESGGALKLAGTAITASAAEINAVDITAAGTVQASKAVVVDANKDIGDFRNLDAVNIDLGASGTAGTLDVFPTTAASGKLQISCDDQTGDTTVTLKANAMGQATTVNVPDPGAAATYVACSTAAMKPAEIDALDGAPTGTHTFVVGAEAVNVINVAIQLKDSSPADMAVRSSLFAYLSDDANGDSLIATAPDGGCAIGTDGLMIPVTPAISNQLLVDGNLAISAVPEKFKTTQTAAYFLGGVSYTKAATDNLTFTAAHVITASKFGIILVQIDVAGTVSTKVPASPQAYDNAGAALAALPAADTGNVALGYIAIENNAGDWTGNTDDLTNGSDVTTAAFTDATEATVGAAKAWHLVSEADGDIDINITHAAGAKTMYLVLVKPNGKMVVSGAITFA